MTVPCLGKLILLQTFEPMVYNKCGGNAIILYLCLYMHAQSSKTTISCHVSCVVVRLLGHMRSCFHYTIISKL